MIFSYNGVAFPNHFYRLEGIETSTLYEGFMPVGLSKTWNLWGQINGSNAASISQQVVVLENIFTVHGGMAAWLDANGSPTAHILGDLNSRCGCRVIKPPSFEPATGIEMGTRRTFRISLQADYDYRLPNLVVRFSETVTFQGDGTEDVKYKKNVIGAPTRIVLSEQTPVRVIQSGTVVGRYGRIQPEQVVSQLFPGYRNGFESTWTPVSAEERHGTPGNPVLLNWPFNYSWVYYMPSSLFTEPNRWSN